MKTLPAGWSEFGRNGSDSVTFIRPGHSVKEPRLAIFDRKLPVANGNGFSVPTYRVRLIDGHVDSEGAALKERSVVEVTVRQPVSASTAPITTSIAEVATILSDAEFVDDATQDFMFPREA